MPKKPAFMVKGSQAAKKHMAKIRSMKSSSTSKHKKSVEGGSYVRLGVRHGGSTTFSNRVDALRKRIARL
jgi:hypothetical protein